MKIKNTIPEELESWTGKDAIEIAKDIRSMERHLKNAKIVIERFDRMMKAFKNKPQASAMATLAPGSTEVNTLNRALDKVEKLDKGMAAVFGKAYTEPKKSPALTKYKSRKY